VSMLGGVMFATLHSLNRANLRIASMLGWDVGLYSQQIRTSTSSYSLDQSSESHGAVSPRCTLVNVKLELVSSILNLFHHCELPLHPA
jgi:hypothetical protein